MNLDEYRYYASLPVDDGARVGLMLQFLCEFSRRGNLQADGKDYCYCLDAPGVMPAGSMVWYADQEFAEVQMPTQTTADRVAEEPR